MTSIRITWCSHHNSWKYKEWYSVMCCVGFAPNITLYSGHKGCVYTWHLHMTSVIRIWRKDGSRCTNMLCGLIVFRSGWSIQEVVRDALCADFCLDAFRLPKAHTVSDVISTPPTSLQKTCVLEPRQLFVDGASNNNCLFQLNKLKKDTCVYCGG